MIKIGDKVRFLNSVGGGIVKRFINKDLVSVEEDDGFEMPVLIKECVVITIAGDVTAENKGINISSRIDVSDKQTTRTYETKEGNKLNAALAYIPSDIKNLSNSDYDAYLINDSNYSLFFTYSNKTGEKWNVRFAGMIEPNTKLHLELFKKDILNEIERVCVQLTAFKQNNSYELKQPVSVELKLDTVKFYKLHSFKENDFFSEEALIYQIVRDDFPIKQVQINSQELESAIKEKKFNDTNKLKRHFEGPKIKNGIVEVDLHIDELIDSTAGMANADILNYQLDAFRNTLSQYKNKKGQKIVFIHGKGDGVLRNALLKELNSKYRTYSYQDASFKEYGFGATMVTIK